ncbi:MAG TPA: hypothetical protein ACFYEK_11005 [Candidatus Wunengus sp. YC60]|uniref:hypothetical protein n=1 Tax=Candidatus Wunengus sp. YC60 TaxID=3367697 RepID=UPI004027276B
MQKIIIEKVIARIDYLPSYEFLKNTDHYPFDIDVTVYARTPRMKRPTACKLEWSFGNEKLWCIRPLHSYCRPEALRNAKLLKSYLTDVEYRFSATSYDTANVPAASQLPETEKIKALDIAKKEIGKIINSAWEN